MATQAKDEWEKAMTELAQEEPELLQHFQKLSEAAGKVGKTSLFFAALVITSASFLFLIPLMLSVYFQQALTLPPNKSSPPVLKKLSKVSPRMQTTCRCV